jgi:glyoxalase family protein
MSQRVRGLHHMTAICGDAQRNVDFYAGLLGLRTIKITVNFDDPTAYHLYYGDGAGTPGSVLTFFPYPTSQQGRPGLGMVKLTSLSVPDYSLGYWANRLKEIAIPGETEGVIDFSDPDGLLLRLVADPDYKLKAPWEGSSVPEEHQIAGMHSVTLTEQDPQKTAALLMRVMDFEHDEDAEVPEYVFRSPGERYAARVDVAVSAFSMGRPGKGTVHHIAFRTPDESTQQSVRDELLQVGAGVSEVRDRDYFKSIYFREPGGVLFEIATDGPGFAIDEAPDRLGSGLRLPKMHEEKRSAIEAALPKLTLPL